jgi:hypothetical protein
MEFDSEIYSEIRKLHYYYGRELRRLYDIFDMLATWNREHVLAEKRLNDAAKIASMSAEDQLTAKHCGLCYQRMVEK